MPASSPVTVDVDLISRYARRGPRYTSYPTAPHFSESYAEADFATDLQASDPDAPLSLYVHVPFCRSLCYYCACHMKVTHRPEVIERYLGYLKREIAAVAKRVAGRRVVQIHWGGGTPTYLTPEQISDLGTYLHTSFEVAPDAEISLEADPRGLTEARLQAAASVGFNRISIGVQDVDPTVQKAINRIQPASMVAQATQWARKHGFRSVNYDLVYGLPHQDETSFRETLRFVDAMRPERIALFSYAHVPSLKKHQRLIPEDALPSSEEKLGLFKLATEHLTGESGYRFIGMDHFALPDDELATAQDRGELHRNFQGYSTHAGADVVAFGVSGISQLSGAYAQNVKGLPDYYARIDDDRLPAYRGYRLTADDHLRRDVIMQLMCHFRLDKSAVEQRHGIDFDVTFADALAALRPMEADGLLRLTDDAIEVEATGRFLIRNVAMAFDAYLGTKTRPVYSQTV